MGRLLTVAPLLLAAPGAASECLGETGPPVNCACYSFPFQGGMLTLLRPADCGGCGATGVTAAR